METRRININEIVPNEGQIQGLPTNPRQWTRSEMEKLKKSLQETPELFEARGILVYPKDGQFIVLGGNMRLSASKALKLKEVPCIIIPEDTPVDKLKEIVIKDNGSFGEWDYDLLANEWDSLPLPDWGVPAWETDEVDQEGDSPMTETERLSEMHYDPLYYTPTPAPSLKLSQCYDLEKFNAKVQALKEYNLTEEQIETLKMFAYRFIKIDFEALANYYYFNAGDEEKKAMERLRLVLVDDGSLGGFIEDGMLKAANISTDVALEMEAGDE